jgi:hypothetical protein
LIDVQTEGVEYVAVTPKSFTVEAGSSETLFVTLTRAGLPAGDKDLAIVSTCVSPESPSLTHS